MSSDNNNNNNNTQLLNIFKQLVKQLDVKFLALEQQLDKIESKVENLRAYNERNHVEILKGFDKINNIKSADKPYSSSDTPKYEPKQERIKVDNKSSPKIAPPSPLPPHIATQPKLDNSFQNFPSITPDSTSNISSFTPTYAGMKATPLVNAFNEEGNTDSSKDDSLYAESKRKKMHQESLRGYLEKLDSVISRTWPEAERYLQENKPNLFIDKGLTVLHGIIEFTFVALRLEFPDPSLSYYSKAKNLSGSGAYKDVSLLEKMESAFTQIENNEKPLLANPLLRGWHERISKILSEFENKKTEAFNNIF